MATLGIGMGNRPVDQPRMLFSDPNRQIAESDSLGGRMRNTTPQKVASSLPTVRGNREGTLRIERVNFPRAPQRPERQRLQGLSSSPCSVLQATPASVKRRVRSFRCFPGSAG